MFCAYCGTSINDDAVFCPACGKPAKSEVPGYSPPQAGNAPIPNQTVVIAQSMYSGNNTVRKRYYPLITLAGKMYSLFFEILLWLTLILGAFIGASFGADASQSSPGLGGFAGAIIGIIIAFITIIVFGGLYSIFMKISANIEEINRKT
jgi:hypothetical protein